MSRYELVNGQVVNVHEMMAKPDVASGVALVEAMQAVRSKRTGKECTVHMTAKFIREVASRGDCGTFEELWAAFDMDFNG